MSESKTSVESLIALAVCQQQNGDFLAAAENYAKALSKAPLHPDALHLYGVVKAQQGQPNEAIALIERAITQRPKFSEALFNLGQIYQSQNRLQDAVNSYVRAARFREGYSLAWLRLGSLYLDVEMYDAATSALETALESEPDNEAVHDTLCRSYKRQRLYEECVRSADRGLSQLPDSAQLWIHRSEANFALGRLAEGWRDYTWRHRHSGNPNRPRDFGLPHWTGESIYSKTIVVLTEQGPGETFLLSTLIPDLIQRADRCIIVTSQRLMPILERSFPDTTVLPEETVTALPKNADVQVMLGDAGQYLRPDLESFPGQTPHLAPDADQCRKYREQYKTLFPNTLLAGLSWRTSDSTTAAAKSATLEDLLPVLQTPGVTFISQQYGNTKEELELFKAKYGIEIYAELDLDPLTDIDSHLSHIAAMDLVISTSNTAAHAAGSVGVETWCLLPNRIGEGLRWYWFADGTVSPWYHNVRLFRQSHFNDWSAPIAQLAAALASKTATGQTDLSAARRMEANAEICLRAQHIEAMGCFAEAARTFDHQSLIATRLTAQSHRLAGHPGAALQIFEDPFFEGASQEDPDMMLERAICLMEDDRPNEAIPFLLKADLLKPASPKILYQLGLVYRLAGQANKATSALRSALDAAPGNREIRRTLGTVLKDCGETDQAVTLFDGLIAEDPTDVYAAHTRGLALLDGLRFDEGWPAYQNRLREPEANISYARFPHPIWNGEPLEGAHVLIWTEQGIGEELLTASLVPSLCETARAVTLLCTERMIPLFRRSFAGVTVDVRAEPATELALNPDIDFQMSMSDLGAALRPSMATFDQNQRKRFLNADESLQLELRSRYEHIAGNRRIVGVSWRSAAPRVGQLKSVDAKSISKLIENCDAFFVSLQYAPREEDIEILQRAGGQRWHFDAGIDALSSMDEAAAQVAAMDTVVTISNSTAHLAGALGVTTALLTPAKTGRHWYWFRGQRVSPWYPSIQLVEQDRQLDWETALENVSASLKDNGFVHD